MVNTVSVWLPDEMHGQKLYGKLQILFLHLRRDNIEHFYNGT